VIDYERDNLLTDFAKLTLKDRYFIPGEESPQEMYLRTARAFSDYPEMAEKIYQYLSMQWLSAASPELSTAPERISWAEGDPLDSFNSTHFKSTKGGMPISCFLNYVPDSRIGLNAHYTENAWLSSFGGGIGGYWGDIRSDGATTSNGSVSTGSIPFLHVVDSQMLAWAQGKTRRGSYAAYMDLDHPEIIEFLEMRKPSGGDINRKNLNLHQGVNIPDVFMELVRDALENGEDPDWHLIDPDSGQVTGTLKVRELYEKILQLRAATGEPYIFFVDTANRDLPETQKAKGLKIHHSNLCSEITLPTNDERTAVCCLASVNVEKFDEWSEDPDFIYFAIRYLDNVLEYFIRNAQHIPKAVKSAAAERSLGLGALGFHSYLQSKNVPFENVMAASINHRVFRLVKERAVEASKLLAKERGEPEDMVGTGLRNAHLLAIAPNASTSILLNTSPSIEPWKANAYVQQTLTGTVEIKNKHLEAILYERMKELGRDREWLNEVWKQILVDDGSVQGIDCLTEWEKEVFKTAKEIDQEYIIGLAGDRQIYLCQSQSVNLFIYQGYDIKKFSRLHTLAWAKGMKSLYYCRSEGARKAENLSESVERIRLDDPFGSADECLNCEG